MRRKTRLLIPLIGVLLVLLGLWHWSPARELALRPSVMLEKAELCDLVTSIYLYGTVRNQSEKALYLAETAYISDISVEVGQHVSAGDVLLTAETSSDERLLPVFGDSAVSVFRELLGDTAQTPVYCAAKDGVITVCSPIDGIITDLAVLQGEICPAGKLCIAVADPAEQRIRVAASETYVRKLREGMSCVITGDAFPDQEYAGKITQIMPYATQELSLSGDGEPVVETWITLDTPAEALISGYSAKVTVELDDRENVLTIPYTAVGQDEDNQEYVFVFQEGKLVKRPIVTGSELEDSVEVLKGMSDGEWYVTELREELMDGQAVRAVIA